MISQFLQKTSEFREDFLGDRQYKPKTQPGDVAFLKPFAGNAQDMHYEIDIST